MAAHDGKERSACREIKRDANGGISACAKDHPRAHARVSLLLILCQSDGSIYDRPLRGGVETGKGDGVKPSERPSVLSAPKNRKLPQAIRFGMAAGLR